MDHRVKNKENEKKNKKKNKYLELPENEETMQHEDVGNSNSNWCARNDLHCLVKVFWKVGNQGTSRYYPNYSIGKIGQNWAKSPGHLRRLAVTKTPMKALELTLVWKICK